MAVGFPRHEPDRVNAASPTGASMRISLRPPRVPRSCFSEAHLLRILRSYIKLERHQNASIVGEMTRRFEICICPGVFTLDRP